MGATQTLSTESTVVREHYDGCASFKTRDFFQEKRLLEALMQVEMKEEVEGGGIVGWCAAVVVSKHGERNHLHHGLVDNEYVT